MEDLTKTELRNLTKKINNYNDDDERKNRRYWNNKYNCFNHSPLILDEVLELLKSDGLICCYCNNTVLLDYPYKYYPKQLTLERMENSQPHHIKNLKVACYCCNMLRNDSMSSEKFKGIFQ